MFKNLGRFHLGFLISLKVFKRLIDNYNNIWCLFKLYINSGGNISYVQAVLPTHWTLVSALL